MNRTTVFNPSQMLLLQMFEANKSKRGMDELKAVLYSHYARRMNDKLDELWDSGVLNQQRLDEINTLDLHNID